MMLDVFSDDDVLFRMPEHIETILSIPISISL